MDNKSELPHKGTNTPNDVGQSEKDIPTRIEVENMVLKGKSDFLQILIYIVLALFALLGAIFPFVTSIVQSGRVDSAIEKMDTNFKELAGKQLRKPKIICRNGNELLLNSELYVASSEYTCFIGIYNNGDGVAGPIDAYIYIKESNYELDNSIINFPNIWKIMPFQDPDYKKKYSVGSCDHISPQDVFNIPFDFHNMSPFDCNAMLEVFYGEPTPIKIPFVLRIGKAKTQ